MARSILTLCSTISLVAGIALLAFYASSRLNSSYARESGLEAFQLARVQLARVAGSDSAKESVQTQVSEPSPPSGERDYPAAGKSANDLRIADEPGSPDKTLWSPSRIAEFEELKASDAETPVALMKIPSVGLELPVFSGSVEKNLTRGAGTIEGTSPLGKPGNTGIAAHRDGYFRSLKDVAVGDRILIEMLDGTDSYRVEQLLVVDPNDIYVLDPTEGVALTLVTCYPFYFVGSAPQRFIVRANLDSESEVPGNNPSADGHAGDAAPGSSELF